MRRDYCIVILLLAALAGSAPARAQIVTDGLGRRVDLPSPPQRIVSLVPSATEMLYALGLENRVVGVTTNDDYPPQVKNKPKVGDMNPSFERVLALHPDLVVLEGRLAKETLQRLESLKLKTLALDSGTLRGMRDSLTILGQATGTAARARQLQADLDRRLARVQARVRAVAASQRPTVFVEIGLRPMYTAGGGTFIDDMVRLAGGRNVFADASEFPQINAETVLLHRPQVVFLTSTTPEEFRQMPGFQNLQAVRDGRVYPIAPADIILRPTPRIADCVEKLNALLYPPR